ncbi:MAG: secondary thiamine-phosphate synthase enzyme YjbQ [Candidatus Nanoarchaeia archaeon]|nr:secondary thiamine-phosphate synthase enzyme YjbQ [Candidatus Nanoarchaeia archaeon]MDD5741790.1 secondary thiamine-phosphate synthase enzyme YjbQ [Candidatus Nanoarchaeia archaeon]
MDFSINTNKREEFIDITHEIEEEISIKNGLVNIFVPHATAAVTINENADPNLPKDINDFLNKLVKKGVWMHDKIDGNADAHIKASLIGSSVMVPVENGKMQLGTWQDIFLCEFDGPRKRKIIISFIGK